MKRRPGDSGDGGAAQSFRRSFGPGLLWAAAAIGVSHLVQSTRAGAMAGFGLAGVILIALVLKYPFFEFGPRYAAATGLSLIEGYRRIGRWALWLYLAITLSTALIVQAAVVLFTSFLITLIFGLSWPIAGVGGLVCLLCAALLLAGRFRVLDATVKGIMALLAVSTLGAASLTLSRADASTVALFPPLGEGAVGFAFLLALVGWMPSAIDISVWSSLWTLAKDRAIGGRTTPGIVLLDFRVGYVGTGFLAFAFLTLGAAVMHGAGEGFSPQGTEFSAQLVRLYTETLGGWTRPIVYTAVLTTMLSTSLTVVDGFPRAIDRALQVAAARRPEDVAHAGTSRAYWLAIAVLGAATVVVFSAFIGSLTAMVDFATVVSFLTAPILGYLNLRAVTSSDVPRELRPGRGLVLLSVVGLLLLGGVALAFIGWRFL